MAGLGTDEQVIIDVLTARTNEQRQQIKQKYKEKYDKVCLFTRDLGKNKNTVDTVGSISIKISLLQFSLFCYITFSLFCSC